MKRVSNPPDNSHLGLSLTGATAHRSVIKSVTPKKFNSSENNPPLLALLPIDEKGGDNTPSRRWISPTCPMRARGRESPSRTLQVSVDCLEESQLVCFGEPVDLLEPANEPAIFDEAVLLGLFRFAKNLDR